MNDAKNDMSRGKINIDQPEHDQHDDVEEEEDYSGAGPCEYAARLFLLFTMLMVHIELHHNHNAFHHGLLSWSPTLDPSSQGGEWT
jgi:hypothetical protein